MGKMWLGVVLSPIQLKRWIWQPDEGSYSQQLSDFVVSLWSLVLGCENVLDFHRRVLRSQGCLISFVSVGWDPSEFLWSSSSRFHPFWTLILLLHWIFEHGFLNRPIFQFLHVCNQYISLSTLLPRPMRVRGMFLARPSYLIGGASTGLMKKSDDVQPLLRTEWSILQMVLQIVSQKVSFPVGWEVLGVSQISTAFHGISPPFFIRAWSQQHCRCSFLFSAHCSFGNPIRLRSMRCRSTMISW